MIRFISKTSVNKNKLAWSTNSLVHTWVCANCEAAEEAGVKVTVETLSVPSVDVTFVLVSDDSTLFLVWATEAASA